MLDKFWESLGGDLAGEWLKRAFSPPFLFFLGGLGLYLLRHDWRPLWKQVSGLDTVAQVALLGLVFIGLILASLLSSLWRFTLLRWMEGYWPWPLRHLEPFFSQHQTRRLQQYESELNALFDRPLTTSQTRRRAYLEIYTHYFPADTAEILPTRLGNILRSGERAPAAKYGLDALVCWPRLWPLLSDTLLQNLRAVHARLLTLAEMWGMGLLFLVWTVWSWWAVPIALLWMTLAYRLSVPVAISYADLIETAFDLHRRDLYQALGWPLPGSPQETNESGRRLTEFLWRGG